MLEPINKDYFQKYGDGMFLHATIPQKREAYQVGYPEYFSSYPVPLPLLVSRELFNDVSMLRVLLQELSTARHFKVVEIEARGDRPADQSIGASVIQGRTEQPAGFDNGQRNFASLDVSPQLNGRVVTG